MPATRIGAMRHRAVIEAVIRTPDGGGGATRSWTPIAEVWAEVRPGHGRERVAADATEARVTHSVRIRYRTGISPAMRLRLDTRLLAILSIVDVGTARRWLDCHCEEITP